MAMRYYAPFPSGGGSALPRGPHALRIGDAERDAAAADLGEHYATGRLSLDELNERLDQVFASRTLGQLARTMTDLPGPGWTAGPARSQVELHRTELQGGWEQDGFRCREYYAHLAAEGLWRAGPDAGDARSARRDAPTAADRAGRFAALSLLLLAMLIWLFTALLFARHGMYHAGPYGPPGSFGHLTQHGGFRSGGPGGPLVP